MLRLLQGYKLPYDKPVPGKALSSGSGADWANKACQGFDCLILWLFDMCVQVKVI